MVTAHFIYMFKEGDKVTTEHDVHSCGLFDRAVWLRLLQDVGFQTRIVVDSYNRDLFVALEAASVIDASRLFSDCGTNRSSSKSLIMEFVATTQRHLTLKLLGQIDPGARDGLIGHPHIRIGGRTSVRSASSAALR